MYIDNLKLTKIMTDYDYQYEQEQKELERQRLLRAETKAYEILRSAMENNESADVIWDDPTVPNIRYYGEVTCYHINPYTNRWYRGEPVLNILQDIGDECIETVFSNIKLKEWSRDIAGDICDAREYYEDCKRTEEMLCDY